MRPTDLWPKDARIIEIGATSGALGERLISAGYENYLAVGPTKQRCEIIARQHPRLRRNVVTAHSGKAVQQNNADVLILNSWASLAIGRFRSVRHAHYVAVKFQPTPLCWFAKRMVF